MLRTKREQIQPIPNLPFYCLTFYYQNVSILITNEKQKQKV